MQRPRDSNRQCVPSLERRKLLRRTARVICAAFGLLAATSCASDAAGTTKVTLIVRFKLTDLDYKPLPGHAVRLVLGADGDWQSPEAGHRFVTDENGEHRFETMATLDKVSRKAPTNFISSLVDRAQTTDHLLVAAELEYMSFRWLYRLDAYRLPNSGDVLQEGMSLYSRNAQGRFVEKAASTEEGWKVADLGGLLLTDPGYAAWSCTFQPDPADPTGNRWTLDVAFKRSPPPVRR